MGDIDFMVRTHAITDTQTDSHTHRLRLTVYAETHSTRRQEAVGYKKRMNNSDHAARLIPHYDYYDTRNDIRLTPAIQCAAPSV